MVRDLKYGWTAGAVVEGLSTLYDDQFSIEIDYLLNGEHQIARALPQLVRPSRGILARR